VAESISSVTYDEPAFRERVRLSRYAFHPEETWKEMCIRVMNEVTMRASAPEHPEVLEPTLAALEERRFIPGGRTLHAAGRPHPQLLNCFVVPIDDTIEKWMEALTETCLVSSSYGGVGLNFSRVRASGTPTSRGPAGGPLMPMRMINYCIGELEQSGGRRGALMFALDHDHPDILDFISMKDRDGEVRNANISVNFRNESLRSYLRRMDRGDDRLWRALVDHALLRGEPGILNGALANEESGIWYYRPLICTNPCGEIWLEPYGCCCLGHIVLPNLVRNGAMDLSLLQETVRVGVRFLDDVLTVNRYPLPAIAENSQKVRRIGLGVTGLHHALIKLGRRYDDLETIDALFQEIRDTAYQASVDLAKERGPFQRWDTRWLASGFAQRLPERLRAQIEQHGLRNCALLTVAPTGTVSSILGVSPGIEPIMGRVYNRIWRENDHWVSVRCEDPLWKEYAGESENRDFREAREIQLASHLAVQATVQRYVDNSVSKTVNVPGGLDPAEVGRILSVYAPMLKGVTLYPEASREGTPFTSADCPDGSCDLERGDG